MLVINNEKEKFAEMKVESEYEVSSLASSISTDSNDSDSPISPIPKKKEPQKKILKKRVTVDLEEAFIDPNEIKQALEKKFPAVVTFG